jgi:hypothetical protein
VFRTDLETFIAETAERPDAEIIAEGAAERLAREAPVMHKADRDKADGDKKDDKRESMLDGIMSDVNLWTARVHQISTRP